MKKNNLIGYLNEIFSPLGFIRKGNEWTSDKNELIKVINLQKSNYGNLFYINYGFIIKGLELTTIAHVLNRLAGTERSEQETISSLLNLDDPIPDEDRVRLLKKVLYDKVVSTIQKINTEEDILADLKKRQHLNDIPLILKRYFMIK